MSKIVAERFTDLQVKLEATAQYFVEGDLVNDWLEACKAIYDVFVKAKDPPTEEHWDVLHKLSLQTERTCYSTNFSRLVLTSWLAEKLYVACKDHEGKMKGH